MEAAACLVPRGNHAIAYGPQGTSVVITDTSSTQALYNCIHSTVFTCLLVVETGSHYVDWLT